jgi:hypothetical protein
VPTIAKIKNTIENITNTVVHDDFLLFIVSIKPNTS